jgi:O-methyltransferase involved in polyketide biosynthesis
MYLSPSAVDGTLAFIQKHSTPGSQIVFDYTYASVLRQENCYYGEQGTHCIVLGCRGMMDQSIGKR